MKIDLQNILSSERTRDSGKLKQFNFTIYFKL